MSNQNESNKQVQNKQAQNKGEELSQSQTKQLRRVAERTQMPTDKTQLIKYLSERIKQAQDALIDTEQLLQEEVKERQKISKALDQRNTQLSKLYEVDQRALPQKIKQRLNEILTQTVTQKIQAEEKLKEEKYRNYQYKARYEELKWEDKNNKTKLQEQKKREEDLTTDIQTLQSQNKEHQDQLQLLQAEFQETKEQKEALQNKYLQMKVALDRMGDVRGVLNRFFSNEDLFDERMDLKEQKIQRLPQPPKDTPLPPPSRDKSKYNNNPSKLKPITMKGSNDDQDFWKADFRGKKGF